jgi:hypothetical protein
MPGRHQRMQLREVSYQPFQKRNDHILVGNARGQDLRRPDGIPQRPSPEMHAMPDTLVLADANQVAPAGRVPPGKTENLMLEEPALRQESRPWQRGLVSRRGLAR